MTFQRRPQCIVRTPTKAVKLGHLVKLGGNHQSEEAIRRYLNVSEIRHCIHIYRKAICLHEADGIGDGLLLRRISRNKLLLTAKNESGIKNRIMPPSVNLLVVDVICKWNIFFRIPNVARALRLFWSRSLFPPSYFFSPRTWPQSVS